MEIQKPDTVRRSQESRPLGGNPPSDITRQNRENIREVTEPLRMDKTDRVELSATAQRLTAEREAEAAERTERLEALRSIMEAGKLNDAERIERAAQQLLSGE